MTASFDPVKSQIDDLVSLRINPSEQAAGLVLSVAEAAGPTSTSSQAASLACDSCVEVVLQYSIDEVPSASVLGCGAAVGSPSLLEAKLVQEGNFNCSSHPGTEDGTVTLLCPGPATPEQVDHVGGQESDECGEPEEQRSIVAAFADKKINLNVSPSLPTSSGHVVEASMARSTVERPSQAENGPGIDKLYCKAHDGSEATSDSPVGASSSSPAGDSSGAQLVACVTPAAVAHLSIEVASSSESSTELDGSSTAAADLCAEAGLEVPTEQGRAEAEPVTPTTPPHAASAAPLLGPPADPLRMTLVLDLDGTLIASEDEPHAPVPFDYCVDEERFVWLRPGLRRFLDSVRPHFEVVLFTAAGESWATSALQRIDPERTIFDSRLYRDHTVPHGDWPWVKDLSRLGRDLSRVVIVDDNPLMFMYQPDNALHVAAYDPQITGRNDDVLEQVLDVLLHKVLIADDVREVLRAIKEPITASCVAARRAAARAAASTNSHVATPHKGGSPANGAKGSGRRAAHGGNTGGGSGGGAGASPGRRGGSAAAAGHCGVYRDVQAAELDHHDAAGAATRPGGQGGRSGRRNRRSGKGRQGQQNAPETAQQHLRAQHLPVQHPSFGSGQQSEGSQEGAFAHSVSPSSTQASVPGPPQASPGAAAAAQLQQHPHPQKNNKLRRNRSQSRRRVSGGNAGAAVDAASEAGGAATGQMNRGNVAAAVAAHTHPAAGGVAAAAAAAAQRPPVVVTRIRGSKNASKRGAAQQSAPSPLQEPEQQLKLKLRLLQLQREQEEQEGDEGLLQCELGEEGGRESEEAGQPHPLGPECGEADAAPAVSAAPAASMAQGVDGAAAAAAGASVKEAGPASQVEAAAAARESGPGSSLQSGGIEKPGGVPPQQTREPTSAVCDAVLAVAGGGAGICGSACGRAEPCPVNCARGGAAPACEHLASCGGCRDPPNAARDTAEASGVGGTSVSASPAKTAGSSKEPAGSVVVGMSDVRVRTNNQLGAGQPADDATRQKEEGPEWTEGICVLASTTYSAACSGSTEAPSCHGGGLQSCDGACGPVKSMLCDGRLAGGLKSSGPAVCRQAEVDAAGRKAPCVACAVAPEAALRPAGTPTAHDKNPLPPGDTRSGAAPTGGCSPPPAPPAPALANGTRNAGTWSQSRGQRKSRSGALRPGDAGGQGVPPDGAARSDDTAEGEELHGKPKHEIDGSKRRGAKWRRRRRRRPEDGLAAGAGDGGGGAVAAVAGA